MLDAVVAWLNSHATPEHGLWDYEIDYGDCDDETVIHLFIVQGVPSGFTIH